MKYCSKCGAPLSDETMFCTNCGQQQAPKTNPKQNCDPDIAANKGMAVLAYIGILVLIPIFAAPNSRYARYHANQGLVLLIAEVLVGVVLKFCSWTTFLWSMSIVLGLISVACNVFLLVLVIIGIVHAVQGVYKPLPLLGEIRILK